MLKREFLILLLFFFVIRSLSVLSGALELSENVSPYRRLLQQNHSKERSRMLFNDQFQLDIDNEMREYMEIDYLEQAVPRTRSIIEANGINVDRELANTEDIQGLIAMWREDERETVYLCWSLRAGPDNPVTRNEYWTNRRTLVRIRNTINILGRFLRREIIFEKKEENKDPNWKDDDPTGGGFFEKFTQEKTGKDVLSTRNIGDEGDTGTITSVDFGSNLSCSFTDSICLEIQVKPKKLMNLSDGADPVYSKVFPLNSDYNQWSGNNSQGKVQSLGDTGNVRPSSDPNADHPVTKKTGLWRNPFTVPWENGHPGW